MSMSGLVVKLSSAVPAKWVWVRNMSSASATTSPTKPSSLFLNTTYPRERISATAIYKDGLRIASCAPIEHDRCPPQKNLGFTIRRGYHHKCFSVASYSSSSSTSDDHSSATPDDEDGGGLPASGGVVADMSSANKDQDWYGNGVFQSHNQSHSPMQHHHQQQHDSSKLLTLPTILTLGRVAAVPFLIGTFYVDSWWGTTATTSIFIAAAITDWLDGYIARKMRLGSAFGAFLDPVADKLMVAATLVLLCTKPLDIGVFGQVPWLLPVPAIAIIGREITMSAVREWAASQNGKLLEAVAVSNLGKWKTATQMTALTILLATRDSSLGGSGIVAASGVGLLYISAGLAVWSLVVYMSKIWRVLLR